MAKKAKKKTLDLTLPIFQLKISLEDISPPIWRRVQTSDCTLEDLHQIIQMVMDWDDMHMHAFAINGEQYGNFRRGGEFDYDSRFVWISEVVEERQSQFHYDYDFGDNWRHVIEVEKTLPAEEGIRYPRCVDGVCACPPEDSGGPYDYPFFLEKLQDPDHEEHADALEWVGEGFDPEAFDLDEANKGLFYARRRLGRRGGNASDATYAKGQLVQVKHGIVHDFYPDIPLGGWVGEIKRIGWLTPIGYAVHWTKPTLEQAPAVYFKRCRRDLEKAYRHWLDEDQLEAAASETPTAMEQPTKLLTRRLSEEDPDDRIRRVFGLTSNDPLPGHNERTQAQFLDYLKTHLSFPFKAEYATASMLASGGQETVEILGFAAQPINPEEGIVCQVEKQAHRFEVPLSTIRLDETDANFRHLDDYTYWLWGIHDDEEDDEESLQFPIGTIAYYGPDDKTTTKIVAGVIEEEGAKPIIKRWVATDVATNPKVRKEIDRFFTKHGVTKVGMSAGNMGCPHEEGKDFPEGGDCPFCPWWKGKQGSGAKP